MPPSTQKVALPGEGANGPEIRHDRQNPQLLSWKGVRQAAGVENEFSKFKGATTDTGKDANKSKNQR